MGAGVFTGIFWGLVVSVLVATAVSLSAPLPPRSGVEPMVDTADTMTAPEPVAEATADVAPPEQPVAQLEAPVTETGPDADAPALPPALAALDSAQPGPSLDPQTGAAADSVPLPAGSEFNRPPPEEAPVLPGTDADVTVRAPSAPEISVPDAPGGLETTPAPMPEIADLPQTTDPVPFDDTQAAVPGAASVAPGAPSAVPPPPLSQPTPDSVAVADAQSVAPPVQADPAPAATPVEDDMTVAAPETTADEAPVDAGPAEEAPADEAAVEMTESEEAAPAAPPVVVQLVPPTESAPLAMLPLDELPVPDATAAEDTTDAMPEPPRLLRPTDDDNAPTVQRTLPQIVTPARTTPEADDSASASDVPVVALDEPLEVAPEPGGAGTGDLPALEAYSVPFDAAETRPLIAVVLIDEPDDRLDIDTLTQFTFPVAFAIDPARADAAERAAAYRAAGFEVVMLASVIPDGATASDTEVALSAARTRVPEAIALMDTPDSRLQSDRVVLEAAVGAAAGEGQGFVAFPRGLNTGAQTAERAGVPAATLFRLLDDEAQRATVITRFLGRAEFAAVQEGAVVVAGRTRPDTVTALFSWALGNRNEGVAIAPLSAVLGRLAEE